MRYSTTRYNRISTATVPDPAGRNTPHVRDSTDDNGDNDNVDTAYSAGFDRHARSHAFY